MESLLGYLVYGVGGLVIILFLGSALLAQRKNSRASVDQEDQEDQKDVEDQEDQEDQENQDQEDLENLRSLKNIKNIKNENLDEALISEEFLERDGAQVSLGSRIKAGLKSGLTSTFSSFKKGKAGKTYPQIEPEFTVSSNQPTIFESKSNSTKEFREIFSAPPESESGLESEAGFGWARKTERSSGKENLESQDSALYSTSNPNSNLRRTSATIRGVANQTNDDSAENQSFLSLLIVAPRGQAFYGEDLLAVFERVGLTHGKYQIFHALDTHTKRPIFSVASAIKPGIFELGYMAKYTTPGLNFFMDLNSSQDLRADFRKMLGSVYEISTDLGGEILDSRRQRLTQSSVSEYLAKIKGIEASSRAFV
jgi:cell division protein ZipA